MHLWCLHWRRLIIVYATAPERVFKRVRERIKQFELKIRVNNMSLYIRELLPSPMVTVLLPALFTLMGTDKYDLLYQDLHTCISCAEGCLKRTELVMLCAWLCVLLKRMEKNFTRPFFSNVAHKIVLRESLKRIWLEKERGFGMHTYDITEDFTSFRNERAKEYMVQVVKEKYIWQIGFPGWKTDPADAVVVVPVIIAKRIRTTRKED